MKAVALVDDADFEWLNQWKWCEKQGYAVRNTTKNGKRTSIRMHRLILGLEPGDPREGDHENRHRHDNRRENLRIVSRVQNRQNRSKGPGVSKHRGVHWSRSKGKWTARVGTEPNRHYLGDFADEADAAKAAREGRKKHLPYSPD